MCQTGFSLEAVKVWLPLQCSITTAVRQQGSYAVFELCSCMPGGLHTIPGLCCGSLDSHSRTACTPAIPISPSVGQPRWVMPSSNAAAHLQHDVLSKQRTFCSKYSMGSTQNDQLMGQAVLTDAEPALFRYGWVLRFLAALGRYLTCT